MAFTLKLLSANKYYSQEMIGVQGIQFQEWLSCAKCFGWTKTYVMYTHGSLSKLCYYSNWICHQNNYMSEAMEAKVAFG